jgi:hypothetical protein
MVSMRGSGSGIVEVEVEMEVEVLRFDPFFGVIVSTTRTANVKNTDDPLKTRLMS